MKKIIAILIFMFFNAINGQNSQIDSLIMFTNEVVNEMNKINDWDEVIDYKIENFSFENASLKTFSKYKKDIKIVLESSNQLLKLVKIYYLKKDKLLYVLARETQYKEMQDAKNSNKVAQEVFETKSYFEDDILVRQLDNTDASCLFSHDYLTAEGSSILDELKVLKQLIASAK
tara:strand:- start:196821 stop:197342 length:522 start_codon:yes stop_codon:yes gene_type:complete